MTTALTFIHALSPLHAGTGQGVGVIDLPIAREKATNIPYLPGSSLKGTMRELCVNKELQTKIFGPDTKNGELHAGSAVFSDQRLLLLPVRSLRGTFAWATSPYILKRFSHELDIVGIDTSSLPDIYIESDYECAITSGNSPLADKNDNNKIYLEEFDLTGNQKDGIDKWAEFIGDRIFNNESRTQTLKERLCVLSDNLFDFLVEHGTEVIARVKIDDNKVVANGSLWYEEALPSESILYGLLVAVKGKATPDEVFKFITDITSVNKTIQLGGKATVGRGLCSVRIHRSDKGGA